MQGVSERARHRLTAAFFVAAVVAAISVPSAPAVWQLGPDASEHLLIAHAWLHGAGWVDPVQWYFYLDANPPLPAFAVRPPLVSLLAAIPLGFGATVTGVGMWHALWASAVAGAMVLVGGRFMRIPAAIAATLLVALSPGWLTLARVPLTEVTALGAFLAVLGSARGVHRSVTVALACAAATWLASLTRPNMSALALAVTVAAVWEVGPRRALRSAPIVAYVLGFATLYGVTWAAIRLATGFGPYAGYGVHMESLGYPDIEGYGREFVGGFAFLSANFDEALRKMGERSQQVAHVFATGTYVHHLGWLLPPAAALAVLRKRDGCVEHRLNALSALGFTLVAVANLAAFEPRYLLLPAACTSLCAFGLLDEWMRGREPGWNRTGTLIARAVPVVLVLGVFGLAEARASLRFSARAWRSYREKGLVERVEPTGDMAVRAMCLLIDPDAVVAASYPWQFSVWCGSASMILPNDLSNDEIRRRFLAEKRPSYLVVEPGPDSAWIAREARARSLLRRGDLELYAITEKPVSVWHAPPPLACAGKGASCR